MKLTYNGLQTLETIKGTRYAIAKLAPAGGQLENYFHSKSDTFKWWCGCGYMLGDTLYQTRSRYYNEPDSVKTSRSTGEKIIW